MLPLVSVVISTYNRAAFLVEVIESVLVQTYPNIEIVVVDDGSTDDTQKLLARYQGRVKSVYQPNSGSSSSPRNLGIAHAIGEYIAILDSDDLMLPEKIEVEVAFMERHPGVGMVFSDFFSFADGKTVSQSFMSSGHPRFINWPKTRVGPHEYVLSDRVCDCLALDNFVGTDSSVVTRKTVFQNVGLFDQSLYAAVGLDMWFRVASRFPIGYIDRPLLAYRVHVGNTLSSHNRNITRNTLSQITVRERFIRSRVISEGTRRELRGRLGQFYLALASAQLTEGRRRDAASSLSESIRRRPVQFLAYRMLGECLLPTRMREALQRSYATLKTAVRNGGA